MKTRLLAALALSLSAPAFADVKVGATLKNVELRDAEDAPAKIPELGSKVLLIQYTDPDVADQNDPFSDKVKAAKLDESIYKGIGVANMKDAPWKPNAIIRSIVRSKIKKYGATILTDPEQALVKAWDLGDCNDKSVVMILDKAGSLKWFTKGALSPEDADKALGLLKQLIAEAKPAEAPKAP
jgi:hypothetical protein